MLKLKPRGLRVHLLLVVLVSVLPVLLLMFWSYLEERRHIAADVQSNLLKLARLVASHQSELIEGTQQSLATLSEIPAVRNGNWEASNEIFINVLKRFSQYVNISALSPDGAVYASGLAGHESGSLPCHACIKPAFETGESRIGEFRVCPVTGKPVLTVASPVVGEDGRVRSVIVAALNLKWLDDIASSLMGSAMEELPQDSVFTLRDRSGTILLRYPGGERWVGQSVPDAPVLMAALEQEREGIIEALGIDNIRRLYAFAPLLDEDKPIAYVSLGVSVDAAYKNADQLLLRNVAGLCLALLIGLFIGWRSTQSLVMSPLRTLIEAVKRLSNGDLTARAQVDAQGNGSNEFDQLARAFNLMASALEERTGFLLEAERKYRNLVERVPAVVYSTSTDRNRTTLYISPQIEALLGYSSDEWLSDSELWVKQMYPDDREDVLAQLERSQAASEVFSCEYRMFTRTGQIVWVRDEASVVCEKADGDCCFQGVMRDITERKLVELNLLKVSRALKTLSDCNQTLIRATEEASLLQETCRILVNTGGYGMAWVGFAANNSECAMHPVAQAGFEEGYLDQVCFSWDQIAAHIHPSGTAIRTAAAAIVQNVMTDPAFVPWRPEAERLGYKSCIAFPLSVDGKVIGALTIYGREQGAFTQDEIALLAELSEDVAFGIATIRARERHKEAEESLRETTQTLQALVKASPLAIVAVDPDANVVMWNRAAERSFGWKEEEVLGRFFPIVPEHELPRFNNLIAGALHGVSLTGVEVVRRRKDGLLLDISLSNAPLYGADGAIKGVMAILEDITSRKRMESERTLLATAVEQAAEGMAITDKKGNIQYVNPAFEHLTGFVRTGTCNLHDWLTSIAENDMISSGDPFGCIHHGHVWFGRLDLRGDNGASRNLAMTVSPVRDPSQKIVHHVAVLRDVTEVVRLERQLVQAQKMEAIGTLAGGIAHDFNNILMGIIGYTEMALDQAPEGSRLRHKLENVLSGGRRATDLVKQILAFSRQGKEIRKPVSIGAIVKETLKLLRASLPTTIEIQKDFFGVKSDIVMADPTQIHQVVLNLCTNAGHAMRGTTGALEVRLRNMEFGMDMELPNSKLKKGPYVMLSVSDTGHGIDKTILDRIFDPFFTTKNRGEGTGLGLAVVQATVESHGGAITVESEVGRGAAFHLFFPRYDTQITSEDRRIPAPVPGGTERILLVDDEASLARMLGEILGQLGYNVTIKTSSIDVLEVFRKDPNRFDLVITDQTMPNLTGADLTRALLRIRPDLPVILCTGFSETITEETARSFGIREFIQKPVLRHQLAETVRKVLDECRVRQG